MSQHLLSVSDSDFDQEVVASAVPVLVDFWAEWCQPCKAFVPILEAVAEVYQSKIKVVKLNIDENTKIPTKYGIKSIPTLLLFSNGDLAAQQVGSLSKSELTAFIEAHI